MANDGVHPEYQLRYGIESSGTLTSSQDCVLENMRIADATILVTPPQRPSYVAEIHRLCLERARQLGMPCVILDPEETTARQLARLIPRVSSLYVTGVREPDCTGIEAWMERTLARAVRYMRSIHGPRSYSRSDRR